MRFLSNAHTHTTYCDGQSTVEEMVEAAQRLGFVSLGFSGHGDQGFDPAYSMADGRQQKYLTEVRALEQNRRERGMTPRLWVGVEEDSLTPAANKAEDRQTLDYVIGSTHYVERDFHGQPVAVDGDLSLLRAYIRERLDGDALEMVRRYFDLHVSSLLTSRPDIIGHFDLPRKYAATHGLFDEESRAYRTLALDALERAYPCGGVLELNTGGMARSGMKAPYPTLELLCAWREMGGSVTLTSDCHNAAFLDANFDLGMRLLARAGFRTVLRLGAGQSRWEEVRVGALR